MFLKYVLRNSPEVGSYSYVSTTMNIIAFLMIVRIQNSIPQVKVTSFTIYIIASFLCSILKIKVWIKETTFPGNIYIALVAGKYKKYCPALAFDLPTQSGVYIYIYIYIYIFIYRFVRIHGTVNDSLRS